MIDNNGTDLKKEYTSHQSFDAIKENHLKTINDQVEEAKDPSSYETYDYSVSSVDEQLKLFTARRKGNAHIINKTPCQDYCLTTSIPGCTILADADGVGSCERSDIGSKLACEAVVLAVKIASKSSNGEDQLVSRLLSTSFRERLVSIWINSVMEDIAKGNNLSSDNQVQELIKYGSTIMFAVITKNWIVTGNLGDGQILVFNDYFGVKLRVHGPKESSRVRCLANERCAREDFIVEKYPRDCFNGVLLSSDGMYECLDSGNHYFDYCIQMKKRFLENSPNEPYQAFCYKEKGEPYKDFSRMRTQDDCSITLAIDERIIASDYSRIMENLLEYAQAAIFKRWSPDCMSFYVKQENYYADVIVSSKDNDIIMLDKIRTAVLEVPNRSWKEGEWYFSEYCDVTMPTIEFMRCSGMLRRDKSNPNESEQMILDVYLNFIRLRKELNEIGLDFNSSAMFNIIFDGQVLHIRKEAVKQCENDISKSKMDCIERCFSHLLGIIESGDKKRPVFDIGYINKGIKHYRFGQPSEELAQLIRFNKKLHLKNTGLYSWKFDDGVVIQPGESRELDKKMNFILIGDQGEEIEQYKYYSKEVL